MEPAANEPPTGGGWQSLRQRLYEPIDVASLALFRVAFGVVALWDVWRFLTGGRVDRYFIEPEFLFPYLGFSWVTPWPGGWMYVHFYVLGALAACIAAGFLYRLSTALFAVGYTFVFLLDQTQFQNHYYLICLLSALMVFVPAHRALSVDARLFPGVRADRVPAWPLWLLRAQLGIVYFFGGIAKLNGDWLRGWPLRDWLPASDFNLPPLTDWFEEGWVALAFSYGGLLVDLLAVPLLLWRRSRPWMLGVLLLFHCMNEQLFHIGVFPYLAAAMTLLFLPAHWPRRVFRWDPAGVGPAAFPPSPATMALLAAYLGVQSLLPLRHWLYPGDVNWTEEGHRFAWHMKLRDKDCFVAFHVRDPATGQTWEEDPLDYLNERQERKLGMRPHMVLPFAHYLARQAAADGHAAVEVRADIECSLNGRRYYRLVDPSVDLAGETRSLAPARWIVPLPPSQPGERYAVAR